MDYVDQGQGQFSLAGAIALAPLVGSEFIPEVYLAILGPEAEGLVKVAADDDALRLLAISTSLSANAAFFKTDLALVQRSP